MKKEGLINLTLKGFLKTKEMEKVATITIQINSKLYIKIFYIFYTITFYILYIIFIG